VLPRASIGVLGVIVAGLSLWVLAGIERARHVSAAAEMTPPRIVPRASPRAVRALRDGQRLDLNEANAADLELLPGIGPSLALRIVQARLDQGAFGAVEELMRVRGIGPATLAKLRPFLYVDSHASDAAKGRARSSAPRVTDPASTPTTP
jgi:competence ComEA-like helix-hairpin-helix protein